MNLPKTDAKTSGLLNLLVILFLVLFISPINSYCQDSPNRRTESAYLELGGNCIVYSLNYERMFADRFSFRVGGSFIPVENELWIPLLVNYVAELDDNNSLELGLGGRIELRRFSNYLSPTGSLGYRFSPAGGRIFLKLAYTPSYNEIKEKFVSWMGVGIGMKF